MSAELDELLARARAQAHTCARRFRLATQAPALAHTAGARTQNLAGSSQEFQDQREYQPGDDPRHLNWRAFARTERLLMKVFQSESHPAIELIADSSASMFHPADKACLNLALLFYLDAAARTQGITVRIWRADASGYEPWEPEGALPEALLTPATASAPHAPQLPPPPRGRGVRLLVSDLLYPEAPESLLTHLARNAAQAWILAPYIREELALPAEGLVQIRCRESGQRTLHRLTHSFRQELVQAYRNHLENWRSSAQRHRVGFVRIGPSATLPEALLTEAVPRGLVEVQA